MPTSPYGSEVRLLLRAALLLFTFTVVIGILNGTDLVDFDRKTLLTHVHAGTLGWITMSAFAGSFWLFSLGDVASQTPGRSYVSTLALLTMASITAYALAFLTTFGVFRPIVGAVVLVTIVLVFAWVLGRARGRTISVPHVGLLAAVTMSVAGAVLGVLLGYRLATGVAVIPATASAAHPATMVIGFLVPVGMAFIEWVVDPSSITRRASIAGWLQIGLPFLGGLFAMIGLLLSITPLITLGLPFQVIGLVIMLVRLRAPMLSALGRIGDDGPRRHGPLAFGFLIVNIALLVYLVVNYFSVAKEPPGNVLLALDHSIFIGVMTNVIFAVIMLFRRPVAPIVDHVVFFGVNLGLIGFLTGLLMDSAPIKQVATPVLGIAILVGVAGNLMALGVPASTRSSR